MNCKEKCQKSCLQNRHWRFQDCKIKIQYVKKMKYFLLHNAWQKFCSLALNEKNDNELKELRLKIDMNLQHACKLT